MHRASKHTSSLVHTDLKSLPVNDSEPCCQLSNLENQVLYSLGLECSQACQKAWKQKHALYMCMGPHPVRGFWRSFGHWCPSSPPLFLILKSSWLVKKGNLQQPLALWRYTYINLRTLPMQNPDTSLSLPPFVSAWSQLQRRVSDCLIPQVSETLGLLPSTSAPPNRDHYSELTSAVQHWHVLQNTQQKIKHALLSRSKCLNSGHHKVKHVKRLPLNITQYK